MLIGSHAYDYWNPGVLTLTDKNDWDIITDIGQINWPGKTVEIHDPNEYLSGVFVDRFASTIWTQIPDYGRVTRDVKFIEFPICRLRGLAAIKRSHLALDHNWEKHIGFYHKYLKQYFDPADWDLMKAREKITLEKAKQKNPKLSKSNDDFFDDYVVKKYSHDMLHEMVAYYEVPLYTKLKYEGKQDIAWCEKVLWDCFSHEDKLKCISEECTVIALERFVIPKKENCKIAYIKALKKVCTTLTSGWFRDYAIDNYEELRMMHRVELMHNVLNKLGEGK